MENGLIFYYETPRTARVRQLRLRAPPVKFRQLVVPAYHTSPLEGHIHDKITIFNILARFWRPMVNKEVEQFIRSYAH